MIRRAILASLAVAALGFAAVGHATEGFRAITAEGARRLSIETKPRSLPDVALEDQNGTASRLSDYKGRPVLIEFFLHSMPDGLHPANGGVPDFERDDAGRRGQDPGSGRHYFRSDP